MSGKSIVIKTVAGILAIGVLLGCIYFLSRPEKVEKSENMAVFSADETMVTRVECDRFALVKNDGTWEMEGMEGIAVNSTFASTLVKSLCNIKSPMLVEGNAKDLSLYGIDHGIEIVLTLQNEKKLIRIGNASGEYYYLTADSDDVYVVPKSDLYMVFLDKIKYIDNTVLEIDTSLITEFQTDNLYLVKIGDDWYEKNPYDHLAEGHLVENYILSCLEKISATDIIDDNDLKVTEKELVQIILSDGSEIEFEVWDGNYINFYTSEYAFKVNDADLAFLDVSGFDVMNKYLAPIAISHISNIDFVSPFGVNHLSIEAPSSEAPVFYKDGKEVSEESFRSFYQSLMGLSYTKEGGATGKSEYSINFIKTDGEVICVEFINASESEFAVSVNSETDFLINKKSVTDVFEQLKKIETL